MQTHSDPLHHAQNKRKMRLKKAKSATDLLIDFFSLSNVAILGGVFVLLGGAYYFLAPEEKYVPSVTYSTAGREFDWKGSSVGSLAECRSSASEKARQILHATGIQIVFAGCNIMNGSVVAKRESAL